MQLEMWLGLGVNLVVELAAIAFFYGRIVERVRNMREAQSLMNVKVEKIDKLAERMTRMETFVEIFIKRAVKIEFSKPELGDG